MKTALIDLDAMLYIIAIVQFQAGNRDNKTSVRNHVKRFLSNIEKNSKCDQTIKFYQKAGHQNYRNILLPQYKEHRKPKEAVVLWKPTILEVFDELDAIALNYIESDDAISVVAQDMGYDKVTVVSGDKDMYQIPSLHYNPFRRGLKINDERRWYNVNKETAERFLWSQILMGDSTDVGGEFCGIEGVATGRAKKILDHKRPYRLSTQLAYAKKYGADDGYKRASLTYKMVKLLTADLDKFEYVPVDAKIEVEKLLSTYPKNIKTLEDKMAALFGFSSTNTNVDDLFS
jgi:5'-3' exonuclease